MCIVFPQRSLRFAFLVEEVCVVVKKSGQHLNALPAEPMDIKGGFRVSSPATGAFCTELQQIGEHASRRSQQDGHGRICLLPLRFGVRRLVQFRLHAQSSAVPPPDFVDRVVRWYLMFLFVGWCWLTVQCVSCSQEMVQELIATQKSCGLEEAS